MGKTTSWPTTLPLSAWARLAGNQEETPFRGQERSPPPRQTDMGAKRVAAWRVQVQLEATGVGRFLCLTSLSWRPVSFTPVRGSKSRGSDMERGRPQVVLWGRGHEGGVGSARAAGATPCHVSESYGTQFQVSAGSGQGGTWNARRGGRSLVGVAAGSALSLH